MRKLKTFLANFLASLNAILFIITAIIALLLFNLERQAFDPNTYKKALLSQNIYEQMPSLLGEILASSANFNPCASNPVACAAEDRSPEAIACFENTLGQETYAATSQNKRTPTEAELKSAQPCIDQYNQPAQTSQSGGPPAYMSNLTASNWETILSAILPPENLKAMTEQAFDQIFAYMNGEVDSPQLSMVAFKTRLSGPEGMKAVLTLMNAQPPCTQEQLDQMTAISPQGEQKFVICNPPADKIETIQALIKMQLIGVVTRIPDQVTLFKPEATGTGDMTPLQAIKIARWVMRLSFLIPLIFLLGILLFVVRSRIAWLRWWGWPMMIAGIFGSTIGFISSPLINSYLPTFIAGRMPFFMPAFIVETSGDLASAVARQILYPVGWEGLLLAIIGMAMILYAAYMTQREKEKLEAAEVPTKIF